jgi:hypothetical protein
MMTKLLLDICKYDQCLCWLPADNVIPCVVTSMLPFGKTQKRKIALLRRSMTRSQPNHAHAAWQNCVHLAASFRHIDACARGETPIVAAPPPFPTRDFLPWRFSAAGRRSAWRDRHPGSRKPTHNQKFATAIGSSQFVQAPQTEAAKRKPALIYSGRLSSLESVEHKKEQLELLFFAFIGKEATHHRRPYTSGTPRRNTPNAGGNRKHQRRSAPRSRCLLEHRGIRRCRRAPHCRRADIPKTVNTSNSRGIRSCYRWDSPGPKGSDYPDTPDSARRSSQPVPPP